jgi:hypothetical protein
VLLSHFNFFDLIATMAFKGMKPIRIKTCINDAILEEITTINYLGYNMSYKGEKDMNVKTVNLVWLFTIINHSFKTLYDRNM